MPTITIDGKQIEVAKGTTVIQAAEQLGINLPRYCYHPGLSIVGQCRICLVEIEKIPKLQVACYTQASEGMAVHTQSPKAVRGRKDVLEFLLVNHPLDCPVCDQAGECFLQEYYMKHGQYDSKMVEDKNKKHKALDIGPHVMLDSERCILCTRCVRFCDEISKSNELGIFNRGDHAELLQYPGRKLDNPYSVNTVDICPVGALTEKDFRFEARVWYLKQTDSICPGCSTGCNIFVHANTVRDHHAEGRRVVRLKPRFNAEVNKWWMCDFGRYSHTPVNDSSRIAAPMLKQGDREWVETTWEVAIEAATEKIKKALTQRNSGQIGIWASPQMTNEDLFVLRQFAQKIGVNQIAVIVNPKEKSFSDEFLIREDKNPNTRGVIALGYDVDIQVSRNLYNLAFDSNLAVLIIFHHDLTVGFDPELLASTLSKVPCIIFIGPNRNPTSDLAHILLPAAAWPEKDGTFTNFSGRVQRINKALEPLGDARPEWMILKRLGKALGESFSYLEAEDVFEALSRAVPAFHSLSYEAIGSSGVLLRDSS